MTTTDASTASTDATSTTQGDVESTVLENGHRRSTPDGDNLLLDLARAQSVGYAELARAAGGRVEEMADLAVQLMDTGSPSPFGNLAHLVGPLDPASAGRLAEALRVFYRARPGGSYLIFSPFPSPDLAEHGLRLAGHPPFMARPPGGPATAPPGAAPGAASGPDDLQVVQADSPRVLADFERTLAEAFPSPQLLPFGSAPRLFRNGLLDSRWRFLVGYLDGEPVGTAAAVRGEGVTLVEAVSTRERFRGRGVAAALTVAAASLDPTVPAVLLSSDLGRGVYQRIGFLPVSRFTLWLGRR